MNASGFTVLMDGLADTSEAPKGSDIYYRCKRCGGLVPSQPTDNVGCPCGNIFIDIDYFRLAVEDYAQFQAGRVASPKRKFNRRTR